MKSEIDERYVQGLVSRNLRRLRARENISQLNLALSAGLTHNFINDIENCQKGISVRTLAKLCSVLKAEPFQFFLPEGEVDSSDMELYINDFNESFQKVMEGFTKVYLPENESE